jgi:hypothetical protein
VYVVLTEHADIHGRAWPGRERIAAAMKVSTTTVDRAIRELVRVGLVVKTTRCSDTRRNATNDYLLPWLAAMHAPVFSTDESSGRQSSLQTSDRSSLQTRELDLKRTKKDLRLIGEQTEQSDQSQPLSVTAAWIVSQTSDLIPNTTSDISPYAVKSIRDSLYRHGVSFDAATIADALPPAISYWRSAVQRNSRIEAKARAFSIVKQGAA